METKAQAHEMDRDQCVERSLGGMEHECRSPMPERVWRMKVNGRKNGNE